MRNVFGQAVYIMHFLAIVSFFILFLTSRIFSAYKNTATASFKIEKYVYLEEKHESVRLWVTLIFLTFTSMGTVSWLHRWHLLQRQELSRDHLTIHSKVISIFLDLNLQSLYSSVQRISSQTQKRKVNHNQTCSPEVGSNYTFKPTSDLF